MTPFVQTGNILKGAGRFCGIVALAMFLVGGAKAQPTYFTTAAGYAGLGSSDGTNSGARFYNPSAVALDSATNLYVADFGNNTIRKITPAGVVTTLAGYPGVAGSANGMGTNAFF